ncbi:DUF3576 domain-containing protein [Marinovum algicola]|jgi:hypothetical protein|uniref:DUF3576 domain-containing protein n=1 Tax=Marinovum algicola TaxID=42444 RepID=A0A975W8U9_9RHOB|nr:Domain protein of unknown function [Marinovum algicola DG 898]SEJ20607.1 protein of unknown function [Marinovum algicola]SLN75581.1 hypothetical protein MAA5396_04516 [Marinovum algicola]
MTATSRKAAILLAAAMLALTACGAQFAPGRSTDEVLEEEIYGNRGAPRSTLWDFFRGPQDRSRIGKVNKYIWNAALEVLDFLPVESVDPFTGVITTGYGTPPGGGRAYRATIYVTDPALDARSLNLALQTRAGPVSAETARAIEDAILTRARQLRAQDKRL